MRRERAPERSPTSFSNGGGELKRVDRDRSEKDQAFSLRPLLASFFASRTACRVKTTPHGSRGSLPGRSSILHQLSFFTAFESGSAMPSRIDSRMPGIDSR